MSDPDERNADWPVELRGVTESVVTTLGPNDLWNVAALGLHAPDSTADADAPGDAPVTARTWGNTRTRRNFHRQGGGYVQFTRDPIDFVDATLSIREVERPVLDSADAWVEVEVERADSGESGDTEWEEWELYPRNSGVERETVPTINRGFGAVVEATVAASRLGVDAYDEAELRNRLAYFEEVARKCGDDRVCAAMDRLRDHLSG
ncbi:DUF447 domain-containing protein [Halorussus salinisoli]|uniref:DUF447 domain-containing protein n=1 Tax=Halorussus salinisoli TaxID=2558242 RepID=UPI0010C1AD05|nr:DUF447 domain-containing protein [Halorussus salinisoli]